MHVIAPDRSPPNRSSGPRQRAHGFALVVTLLISLVLFLAIFSISATLSLGNRTTAQNQEMTSRAQLLADSGLGRLNQRHQQVQAVLQQLNINFNGTASLAVQQDELFAQMYRFCYGDPSSPPAGAPEYKTFLTDVQKTPEAVTTVCNAFPVSTSTSNSDLANLRLALFTARLDETVAPVYGKVLSGAEEQDFWAALAKGQSNKHLVANNSDSSDQYEVTMTLQPVRLEKQATSFILTLGNLADTQQGLDARGQVASAGDAILADRRVSQSSLIQVRLVPPSFARLGYFYDKNNTDSGAPVLLGSGFSVDGPFHTNGNVVFQSKANPPIKFSSEFRSAGCPNGATTATTTGGIVVPVCAPLEGTTTTPTPEMAYYLDNMSSTSKQVPSSDTAATGLHEDLKVDFVQENAAGNDLCTIDGRVVECPTNATDDQKLRDVDWAATPIPMPTKALDVFKHQGSSAQGGFTFDASVYNQPWVCQYQVNKQDATDTAPTTGNPGTYTLPDDCKNAIGKYADEPRIRLSAENGTQRIIIDSMVILNYNLEIQPWCGGDGDDSTTVQGQGVTYLPRTQDVMGVLRSHLSDLGRALTLLSPVSTAYASSTGWPDCGDNKQPTGYTVNWKANTATVRRAYTISKDGTVAYDSAYSNGVTKDGNGNEISKPVSVDLTKKFSGVMFGTDNLNLEVISHDTRDPDTDKRNRPEIASYMQLTIATGGNVTLKSDLTYATDPETDPSAKNILGIYAGNDVLIDVHSGTAKDNDAPTDTYQNLNIDAILMAQEGSVEVKDVCVGGRYVDKGDLNIKGSVIQNRVGATGCLFETGRVGYSSKFEYDDRTMLGFAPPAFPTFATAPWTIMLEQTSGRFSRARKN